MKFPKIVLTETDKPVKDTLRETAAGGLNAVADAIEHPTHVITKPQKGIASVFSWLADAVEPDEEAPKPRRKRRARKS